MGKVGGGLSGCGLWGPYPRFASQMGLPKASCLRGMRLGWFGSCLLMWLLGKEPG